MLAASPVAFAADGGDWTVSKSSGEVWLAGGGVQQASLKQQDVLKPGDTVRTGRTGRVLLKRGDETILVSPDSVVGVPAQQRKVSRRRSSSRPARSCSTSRSATPSISEVETPYLAAVVKGTQFRVTVNAGKTTVDVVRGQVEVADFKSGQIAQVMAGQHATAFASGKDWPLAGWTWRPRPDRARQTHARRRSSAFRCRAGFTAMRHGSEWTERPPSRHPSVQPAKHGVTRISSPIGEVRLNVHRVTHGLARDKSAAHGGTRNAANKDTIWGSSSSGNDARLCKQWSGQRQQRCCQWPDFHVRPRPLPGSARTVAAVSGGGNGNNGNGNESGNSNGG